jgi:hypothetical protein
MKIDKYILTDIENCVAQGNKTNEQIAKAIGMPIGSYKTWYYEQTKQAKLKQSRTLIKEAIERGAAKSRPEYQKIGESSLMTLVKGKIVEDVRTEVWYDGDPSKGANIIKAHVIKTKREIMPNAGSVYFALVNNSNDWESINNIEKKEDIVTIDDRLKIAKEIFLQ